MALLITGLSWIDDVGNALGCIPPEGDAALVDAARNVRWASGDRLLLGVMDKPRMDGSIVGEDDGESGVLSDTMEGG